MNKQHQKHSNLEKPQIGNFGRNEWAIVGTTCEKIKQLSGEIIAACSNQYNIGYIDADHKSVEEKKEKNMLLQGASLDYCDKIEFHRFDFKQQPTPFQDKVFFNEQDLVLINGNHFEGSRQIVVLDDKKTDSLEKRLSQLTQVDLILKMTDTAKIPDFLKNHLPNFAQIPIKNFQNTTHIIGFIKKLIKKPALHGLVLAGGKSERMGQDKGKINYHGKEQRLFLYDLMEKMGIPASLSCRSEQVSELPEGYNCIKDTFLDLGPFGAILSAFRHNPNVAYLVVACDLPFLDENVLNELLAKRAIKKVATTFISPNDQFPEPLISIWEPKAYPILLQFLAQGYSCPRKVLINSDIELMQTSNPKALNNVNLPEELAEAMNEIKS